MSNLIDKILKKQEEQKRIDVNKFCEITPICSYYKTTNCNQYGCKVYERRIKDLKNERRV